MAVESLLAVLEQQAMAEAEARRARGRANASEIVRRAEAEVARQRAAQVERLETELRARLDREVAQAVREARRRVLEARARVLDVVFARARDRLASLPLERYAGQFALLLAEALPYLGGEPAVAECCPAAAPLVQQVAGSWPNLTVAAVDGARSGVLLRSADGRVEIDQTLPARLDRLREALAVSLSQRLGA